MKPEPAVLAPAALHPPLVRELTQLVRSLLAASLRDAAAADTDTPLLHVRRASGAGPGPKALAALHPGDAQARAQALALYTRCLQHYRQHVQPRLSVAAPAAAGRAPGSGTTDDLGAAAAYFVLANLGAFNDHEPDAAALPAVERQLRSLLTRTSAWSALPLGERQLLFEQLACLGVLVNESRVAARQQGPASRQNLLQAAQGYLQQFLGLQAERVSVSVQGLAVADQLH